MKKNIVLMIILTLSVAMLIGFTSCSTSKTTGTTTSGSTVNIVNFSFAPGTLPISAGTTVTWTNSDSTTHHVASDTGVFDSGDMAPNATFSYTFNTTGTFPYHCSIHTYMKGTIAVH